MANEPITVLDFDAVKRETRNIKIAGVHYPMMDPEDYSIEENALFRNAQKLLNELSTNPTPENIKTAKAKRDELVLTFVPGLKDNPIFESLKPQMKEGIINAFFEALAEIDYRPKPETKENEESSPNP